MNGHNPKVIDIGGGFSAEPGEFYKAVSVINKAIDKVPRNRKIIAEPGRYFAQPSQDLFVKVIAKKPGKNGWRYVIDESLYGHFSCIPFDYQKPAWFRVSRLDDIPRIQSNGILFGRTCDSLDVIASGKMETLEVGDWLYFPLMGAYTSATASEFNGFPKPLTIEDSTNLLPSTKDAYDLIHDFNKTQPVTYSNALTSILS
jgi:ornithine decarboxylase